MEKLIKFAVLALTEMKMAQRATSRFSAAAICAAFAFFTALATLGCAIAALWIYLIPVVGGVAAALWSAFALLIITVGLMLAAKASVNGNQRPIDAHPIEDIVGEVRKGMSNNKTSVLLAALLAGLMMGRR